MCLLAFCMSSLEKWLFTYKGVFILRKSGEEGGRRERERRREREKEERRERGKERRKWKNGEKNQWDILRSSNCSFVLINFHLPLEVSFLVLYRNIT